ncbi:MAG: hypothetical protein AAB908_02645 [Patescibacteria group bacterium]
MLPKAFTGPSGRTLTHWDLKLWCELETNGSFGWNPTEIEFNSGFKCHIYLRGRNDLSDNTWLLSKTANSLDGIVDALPYRYGKQQCYIGIPTAGTQLATALAFERRGLIGHETPCFRSMRTELKKHGKDNMWIDPPDLSRHTYISIENVMSTAGSMITAFERMESDGYPTMYMDHVVFADWELGGLTNLHKKGYEKIHVRYVIRDIIAAFVHIGRWPKERWDYIEPKLAVFR